MAWVRDQLPGLVGEAAVAQGDLRVYTSLDLDLQQSAQAAVAWHVGQLKDRNVTNGAVVAIDPQTGQVLAMVGSADYFDADIDGAVNLTLAERQPGSSIKPVVYAAALEAGFTPASPLLDVPTTLKTRRGEPYAPNNYDFTFHGVVPLREALASSYNVPAVRVLAAIGVERAFEMGRRLGLTTFRDPSRYDLSLTLGGGEVRLLDLTAAYAAFAIGGARVDPVAVLRVEDSAGNVLYEAPRALARAGGLAPDRLPHQRHPLGQRRAGARIRPEQPTPPRPAGRRQDRDHQRLPRQLDGGLHASTGRGRVGGQRRQQPDAERVGRRWGGAHLAGRDADSPEGHSQPRGSRSRKGSSGRPYACRPASCPRPTASGSARKSSPPGPRPPPRTTTTGRFSSATPRAKP